MDPAPAWMNTHYTDTYILYNIYSRKRNRVITFWQKLKKRRPYVVSEKAVHFKIAPFCLKIHAESKELSAYKRGKKQIDSVLFPKVATRGERTCYKISSLPDKWRFTVNIHNSKIKIWRQLFFFKFIDDVVPKYYKQ